MKAEVQDLRNKSPVIDIKLLAASVKSMPIIPAIHWVGSVEVVPMFKSAKSIENSLDPVPAKVNPIVEVVLQGYW